MTHDAHIQLVEGWTPTNAALIASIGDEIDAWHFVTLTEALLTLFLLETHNPRLVRGFNFIPVPQVGPEPQLTFAL
jgi:hypothetical protein